MSYKVINDDASRHRNVHRVLCTKLRYLQTSVRGIDDLLMNTFYFVTQHNGITLLTIRIKRRQLR